MIYRYLYSYLLGWKNHTDHIPIILTGARQVGKTTLINEFGKEFNQYIYVNLEKKRNQDVFSNNDNISEIVDLLFIQNRSVADGTPSLLFLDEIQNSPEAIRQLRYFKEERSDIHVIAAGSLLEFAFGEVRSFPVGRVQFMNVYPLNFPEFLGAIERTDLIETIENIQDYTYAHSFLIQLFNEYIYWLEVCLK